MIRILSMVLVVAVASLAAVGAEAQKIRQQCQLQPVKGTVKPAALNVRVRPGPSFSVVSKLKRNDDVAVLRQVKDWYEIVLPADAAVWIAASQVKDGKTVVESRLRAMASVEAEAYANTLPAGIEVSILDKSKADWFKITAPATLTGWVSKSYIAVSAEDAKKLEAATVPGGDSQETKVAGADKKAAAGPEDKKTKATDKGKDKTLPFVAGSDKNVTLEGMIYPLDKKDAGYVTHALLKTQKDGSMVAACYLHSAKQGLAPWNEKNVQIKGKQRKVRGWKMPVVEVEKIAPVLQGN